MAANARPRMTPMRTLAAARPVKRPAHQAAFQIIRPAGTVGRLAAPGRSGGSDRGGGTHDDAVPTLPMLLTSWPPSRAPRLGRAGGAPASRAGGGPRRRDTADAGSRWRRAGQRRGPAPAASPLQPLPTGSAAPDARLTIGRAATLAARVMIMSTRGMSGGLPAQSTSIDRERR